ncbi:hypothetical protein [Paenibacillus taichungensis]
MQNKLNFQLTMGFSESIRNTEEVARSIANGILNQAYDIGITGEDDDGFMKDLTIGSEEGVPLIQAEIALQGPNLNPLFELSEKEAAGYMQREALRKVSHGLAMIAKQMDLDDRFREWIEATPFFSYFTECIHEVSLKVMDIIPEPESIEEASESATPITNAGGTTRTAVILSEQTKKDARPVLVSATGLVNEPNYHVFFYPARQLETELAKFLKMETGLDLTISLAADENGDLSLSIKEENNSISVDDEEMTVTDYLNEKYNYSLYYSDETQTARDVTARFFDFHVNDLAHLQYFEDEDNREKSEVRMSIAVSALQANSFEDTIGGSYLARRAVSNMLYFLIKAADQEVNLSLTYPRCSIFEDAVGGSILEWVDDLEQRVSQGDPAIGAIEELLKEELVEGTYLTDGSESYLKKLQETLAPGNDDPKKLVIYQILERLVMEAEAFRIERDKE